MTSFHAPVKPHADQRRKGFVISNRPTEWIIAALVVFGLAWFMMEYHRLWRAKGYGLTTLNECLAIGGTVGIGLALLMGRFGAMSLLRLRRPIGVLAVGVLAVHGVLSLIWYQKYALDIKPMLSLGLGLIAMAGLGAMAITSYRWALDRLGPSAWRSLQRGAYLFFVIGVTHYMVLDKIPKWISWYEKMDKPAPPGTIVPFIVALIAVVAKLISMARRSAAAER